MRPLRMNVKLRTYFSKLIDNELKNNSSPIFKAQQNLSTLKGGYPPTSNEFKVIELVLIDFKAFLLQSPYEQQTQINLWFSLDPFLFYKPNTKGNYATSDFGNKITEALNYTGFRSKYAINYAEITGVKVCPYCNSVLTVSINKTKKKKKARFQLDHYFPKAKYPLLSISFFNLIPSCASCNQGKSVIDVVLGKDFHLYADETPLNGFQFSIPSASVARFALSSKLDDIEINLEEGSDSTALYANHHNKTYGITSLYETQKDIIQEIFWKKKAYPKTRITELSNILKLDTKSIKRMVLGNYINITDIHKRPMSKFTQDIAKQLGLIK